MAFCMRFPGKRFSTSFSQNLSARIINECRRAAPRADFSRQYPHPRPEQLAALCLSFGWFAATHIRAGRNQRHAQPVAQACCVRVGGDAYREFGVAARQPVRRARGQKQGDRAGPMALDAGASGGIQRLQERLKPMQAVADQNQALVTRPLFQCQQTKYRAGIPGVTAQAVTGFGCVGD